MTTEGFALAHQGGAFQGGGCAAKDGCDSYLNVWQDCRDVGEWPGLESTVENTGLC